MNAEQLSGSTYVILVVKSFTIWLHFAHMENQHTVDLLRLPNVCAKTTQVLRLFCSNIKITVCVNEKCYVNFLRKAKIESRIC